MIGNGIGAVYLRFISIYHLLGSAHSISYQLDLKEYNPLRLPRDG